MSKEQRVTDQIESNLVIERIFKADVRDLWALWTTKDGFESWWGPEQFRVDVHTIEARPGGALHYDMVADTPEAIAAMESMNAPTVQPCRGIFSVRARGAAGAHPAHRFPSRRRAV
jgi:uncharacterized protein YndB with AHSA1/START domain